jgi:hypothetical protein
MSVWLWPNSSRSSRVVRPTPVRGRSAIRGPLRIAASGIGAKS